MRSRLSTCRWLTPLALLLLLPLTLLALSSPAAENPAMPVSLTHEELQWLKAHPIIRLAPDPDFKPIEYFDKNGMYQGAAADIIRILERKLGITITIVQPKNWDEAMEKFRNHQVDLLGAMVRTPNREKFALFSDTLVAMPGGIFARSGGKSGLTLKELKGKKVAVVSNYAAHDILKNQYPEIKLEVVPDISTGLAKASLGMVDAYVENMANATFYAQEAGITNLQLVGSTGFDYRWGIGIRKDWPELQGILNKGLAAISEEERQQAISRWIHINSQRWQPSRTFLVETGVASLAGLLLLAIYWSYSLRRQVRSRTLSLQEELAERQKAEQALTSLTGQLEERVTERTRALKKEVADRLSSEQAALASEQRFRELFENLSDPVYISDMAGRMIAVNTQACKELGYSHDELLQMHILDIDAIPEAREKLAERFKVFAEGTPLTFETAHRRKDGSVMAVELHARLIYYDGQPAVLGVARNISERKQAEEERIKLEQQMLHAQKLESLGVLAGGIAHDFNNILTVIVGNAELALMRLAPESPVLDNLLRIERSAARAADLAKQMLAYSGKGKFIVEQLDLNRLIEEMTHMLQVSISKKAALRFTPFTPLPSVEGDATQLRQIVMNLVINASEALDEESGTITISTGSLECDRNYLKNVWLDENLEAGRYVYLEVADTGCGMDSETMTKLFDPFFTTKFTGRGLGMAAVLGIIRGHKGAIKVSSEPGQGSTFQVLLPTSGTPPQQPDAESAEDIWQGSGTALLVDDEETVREIGSELLKELGYQVVTADDGVQALEIFRKRSDLSFVILDLTMPHMDGEQCFRELRQLKPDATVIMSSGFSEQEINCKFTGMGLAGFVQKPYRLAELKESIRKALAPNPTGAD